MILVFGAGGFIGTYLIDELVKEGFEVIASDIDPIAKEYYQKLGIPFLDINIMDSDDFYWADLDDTIKLEGITAVVNLACLQPVNVSKNSHDDSEYIHNNVLGNLNILDFCVMNKIPKFIYTISHRGVQGLWEETGSESAITEHITKALRFDNNYSMFSISECAAADCVEYYAEKYKMQNIILRLPPVYGYGPHLEGYSNGKPLKSGFMTFIENALQEKPIELWGDANRSRDIIYVKDVVSAIILALRNEKAKGLYNISSGHPVSLYNEAKAISAVFSNNKSLLTFNPNKPNSIECFTYDISKAKKELQWEPQYYLDAMMSDIKKEMESKRFEFLIEKRKQQFKDDVG